MKLTFAKENIVAALKRMQNIAKSERSLLTSTSTALLKAEEGKVELTATDCEIIVKTSLKAEIDKSGSICLPVRVLSDILKELPGDDGIVLEITGQRVDLTSGKSRFSLNILPADQFPSLPEFEEVKGSLVIPGNELSSMLNQVKFAASNDETKRHLCGVLFEGVNGEKLILAATDGYRLAITGSGYAGVNGKYIVPKKAADEIAKLADTAGKENVTLSVNDRFIRLTAENTVLTARLTEGQYPDYNQFIQTVKSYSKRAFFNRDAFLGALKRVMLLSDERTPGINFSAKGRDILMNGSKKELGKAVDYIEAVKVEGDLTVGFNGRYIKEAVSVLTGENIVLSTNGEHTAPILVTSEGIKSVLQVVMPMAIPDAREAEEVIKKAA